MKLGKELKVCGIYGIQNIVNNKIYVGKAKNIYKRIQSHIYGLNSESKDENRHLINALNKYGFQNFKCFVIEELEFNENILKERELYWIQFYKSTDREFGYNLRMDSSTKMIVHDETRKLQSISNSGENNPNFGNKWTPEQKRKMSEIQKERYKKGLAKVNLENSKKGIEVRNQRWKENPELKELMKQRVREKITLYNIEQYDKQTNQLIKVWDCVNDIIIQNPTYKRHNIYAVCSGEKPTMYGYIWKKVLKSEETVQTDLKESE